MSDLFNKLLILRTPGIGPAKYMALLARFGSVSEAVEFLKPDQELKDCVNYEMDAADKLNIIYLSDDDERYPKKLFDIKNHVPILTVRGNLSTLSKDLISIVGTRHASIAGANFIARLSESFAMHNFTVVSGMAMGTDTAAHVGALRANGDAQTIAVLAGGADYIWPLENESLYYKILDRGAIVSEMTVGTKPITNNFVQRNRIIAGLAERLILGEADLKSGSMTTANFAIGYGRSVFAVPSHPSDGRSVGPNKLIKEGKAILCTGITDFFEEKKETETEKIQSENYLLDRLGTIPVSESVLAQFVKKPIAEIKTDLIILELQGFVKKQNGGYIKI